jgi:hypothetical protein
MRSFQNILVYVSGTFLLTWSLLDSVWNGAKHRTHLTAMKSNRAVVSCNVCNTECKYTIIIDCFGIK